MAPRSSLAQLIVTGGSSLLAERIGNLVLPLVQRSLLPLFVSWLSTFTTSLNGHASGTSFSFAAMLEFGIIFLSSGCGSTNFSLWRSGLSSLLLLYRFLLLSFSFSHTLRLKYQKVELKVNKMTSVHTQVPYDYYALKFCKPRSGVQQAQENLGEFLTGDRIENSPYQLFMEQDQFCNILCMEHVKSHDVQAFKAIIKEEYHHNWIIDNLPAASILDSEQYITTTYAGGFPVGYQDGSKTFIFNHVNIIVEYHPLDDGSRVVGFYVEPFTVKHRFLNDQGWDGEDIRTAPPLSTCDKSGPMVFESISEKQEVKPGRILFTYDVMWRASNVKWASRWDIYLTMDNAVPDKVR